MQFCGMFFCYILARQPPSALSEAIGTCVDKKYVFVVYRETNVGNINHPGLSRMKAVLRTLHNFSEKMSFTQKELETALTALAERQRANGLWGKLKETDVPEWACTISKRLRAACRDMRQGLDKKRPWASELLSEGEPKDTESCDDGEKGSKDMENETGETDDIAHVNGEDADEKGKDEAAEAVDDVASAVAKKPACAEFADPHAAAEFIVGWDKQLQKAYRVLKSELKSRKRRLDKEWTENCPFAKEGGKECDATYVFFADEKTAMLIPNLLAKDIDSVQKGPSKGSLGYHLVSGHEIALRRITDRDPLCIIVSGSPPKTQICSVPMKLFSKEEDAFMLLEPIARRFMRNEIVEADLYKIRDEELKKQGIVYNKSQAIRKKGGNPRNKEEAEPTSKNKGGGSGKDGTTDADEDGKCVGTERGIDRAGVRDCLRGKAATPRAGRGRRGSRRRELKRIQGGAVEEERSSTGGEGQCVKDLGGKDQDGKGESGKGESSKGSRKRGETETSESGQAEGGTDEGGKGCRKRGKNTGGKGKTARDDAAQSTNNEGGAGGMQAVTREIVLPPEKDMWQMAEEIQ
jgi:hypothetical protein